MTEEARQAPTKSNLYRLLGAATTILLITVAGLAKRSTSEKAPHLSENVKDHVRHAQKVQLKKVKSLQKLKPRGPRDLEVDLLEPEMLFLGRTSAEFDLTQDQGQLFIMFGQRGAEITCETSADYGGDADLIMYVGFPGKKIVLPF